MKNNSRPKTNELFKFYQSAFQAQQKLFTQKIDFVNTEQRLGVVIAKMM